MDNPFWNNILVAVLGAVSFVGAKISANWIADHTYRANRTQPSVVQMVQPNYQHSFKRVMVPNYFKHSSYSSSYKYRRPRSRH